MKNPTFAVTVAALSLVAAVWLYNLPDPTPEMPDSERAPAATADVRPVETPLSPVRAVRGSAKNAAPTDEASTMRARAPELEETAVPITPGFESVLEPSAKPEDPQMKSSALERHLQLLAESRDVTWADQMEPAIRNFVESRLLAQGRDAQSIELPVIECRATLCEVQAAGSTSPSRNPSGDFRIYAQQMLQGPFASEFADSSTTVLDLPDGRTGYLTFLLRDRER